MIQESIITGKIDAMISLYTELDRKIMSLELDLQEQDKQISKLYQTTCRLERELDEVEGELRDLDDVRDLDAERIGALEDCVYDVGECNELSDIEDEPKNVKENTEKAYKCDGNVNHPPLNDTGGYYYIDSVNIPTYRIWHDFDVDKCRLEVGNVFRTEEEARAAVEKLKAWKRLRDGGFKFKGWKQILKI